MTKEVFSCRHNDDTRQDFTTKMEAISFAEAHSSVSCVQHYINETYLGEIWSR